MASAFKTPIRDFQLWSNAFVLDRKLPFALISVDNELGAETWGRVVDIKLCLGYARGSATREITDTLLRQLQHPLWRQLFSPIEWTRGLAYRHKLRQSPPNEKVALARAILAHKNAVFAYFSPTGGTAKAGIVAAAEGRKAHVAQTGHYVEADVRTLRFLLACCKRGRTLINCVVNGHHRDGSLHWEYRASDIQEHTAGTYPAARETGAHVYDEDTYHDHVWVGTGGP